MNNKVKMLVTQALDERDLLAKKINDKSLAETEEEMRLSILGRESKTKEEKPLEVVDTYIKENTMEMADPLDIVKKMEALQERKDTLLSELETQIKVSNATTFISI